MYDPAMKRWTTQDPLGLSADDANLYRFVGNDPVNGTDPSGEIVATPPPGSTELSKEAVLRVLFLRQKAAPTQLPLDLLKTRTSLSYQLKGLSKTANQQIMQLDALNNIILIKRNSPAITKALQLRHDSLAKKIEELRAILAFAEVSLRLEIKELGKTDTQIKTLLELCRVPGGEVKPEFAKNLNTVLDAFFIASLLIQQTAPQIKKSAPSYGKLEIEAKQLNAELENLQLKLMLPKIKPPLPKP